MYVCSLEDPEEAGEDMYVCAEEVDACGWCDKARMRVRKEKNTKAVTM